LQTRADVLNAENEQLKKTDRYSQWFYGGIFMGAGVILYFILQALGRRKRQSEWR
jgi:SH3 domain protein